MLLIVLTLLTHNAACWTVNHTKSLHSTHSSSSSNSIIAAQPSLFPLTFNSFLILVMMKYDLAPKKMGSNVDNVEHCSVYGDMHASRDALLNAEHVTLLRQHDMIELDMAVELLKPFHRDRKYTETYLRTHPDYTGVQPEMSSLSTAERQQKMRDQDMEKFVEDYEAVMIDENGIPIAPEGDGDVRDASIEALPRSHDLSDELVDPSRTNLPIRLHTSSPEAKCAESVVPEPEPAQISSLPLSSALSTPPPSSPDSLRNPTESSPQGVKRKYRVEPLQPLPGSEDYSKYKYYELLAVCRERQIYSTRNTQEVRNCLIQDDINIELDLPRDIAKYKAWSSKHYLHKVPAALKRGKGKT